MTQPMHSLIASGTKVWLDSVDPDEVIKNRAWGITGATSNPIIVMDLIRSGRFDHDLERFFGDGLDDAGVAWALTDMLVSRAEAIFRPVWDETHGNDGYVSFELDPLLEDPDASISHEERKQKYIELAKKWSEGHPNRMIKVPATPAGIAALEQLSADGIALNVTLTFSPRQYAAARDAIWRGAAARDAGHPLKSVYSIFVSRIDTYTQEHTKGLSPEAQGQVGILNAKKIWLQNRTFWADKATQHTQEIVFASTGTKSPDVPAWKYAEAFAGADIETNPPFTNQKIQTSDLVFHSHIEEFPPQAVIDEIESSIDWTRMEEDLLAEGIRKFVKPQKELLALIAERRAQRAAAGGA